MIIVGAARRTLTVALNYGGQQDIERAAERMAEAQASGGEEKPFFSYLETAYLPAVDMLIRTGASTLSTCHACMFSMSQWQGKSLIRHNID